MESYAHKGIFRTKSNIYNGAFFTSVRPYFKNVLNSIELPLGSIFYTTHPFAKKLKLWEKNSSVSNIFFFFEIQNCSMEWRYQYIQAF